MKFRICDAHRPRAQPLQLVVPRALQMGWNEMQYAHK
jgi:hypothetical protein